MDESTAKDVHVLLEEQFKDLEAAEARLPEVLNAINEVLIRTEGEEARGDVQDLLDKQMMVFQEKSHMDAERGRLLDQIMTIAGESPSKEQFIKDVNLVVNEFKTHSERFLDNYANMLISLQAADTDNPLINDILSEMGKGSQSGDGTQPEGEPQPGH